MTDFATQTVFLSVAEITVSGRSSGAVVVLIVIVVLIAIVVLVWLQWFYSLTTSTPSIWGRVRVALQQP